VCLVARRGGGGGGGGGGAPRRALACARVSECANAGCL